MGFFSDLLNTLSGKAKQDEAKAIMQAQLGLSQQQLNEELEESKLKYSPERQAQITRAIGYIVIGIVIIIIAYLIIRYLRG